MSKQKLTNKTIITSCLLTTLITGCSTYQSNNVGSSNNSHLNEKTISTYKVDVQNKAQDSSSDKQQNPVEMIDRQNNALPEGVSQSWLAEARKYIHDSEYYIKPYKKTQSITITGNGLYQAPNRAHNLRTYFEEDGIRVVPRDGKQDWEWGLTLKGYGTAENIQPVAKATKLTSGNRIEYQRDNITEWYVNDNNGLEQGFTIQQAPQGNSDEIIVEIEITGDLNGRLHNNNIAFHHPVKGHALNYNKLIAWDANDKILDAQFKLVSDTIIIAVNTNDAEYPIVIDPITTGVTDSVLQSNQSYGAFGRAVANAGDVNGDGFGDVIVSAETYDDGELDEGAVFVFYGSVNGITSSSSWDPEDTGAGAVLQSNVAYANFGTSVASAGDVNGDGYSDIIIGDYYYDDGQSLEGAAFIFYGSSTGIISSDSADPDGTGPLTGINADAVLQPNQATAFFGYSVAGIGDVNSDGYSDVVVGAYEYDDVEVGEGAAFVFYGSATGINSSDSNDPDPTTGIGADAVLQSNQADADFGRTVASADDVNNDGYSDLLVGAYLYDDGENAEGAAFIFYGSASGITSSDSADPDDVGPLTGINADVVLQSNQVGGLFANSVASAGDLNHDGYSDIIIGADRYEDGEADEGAVFIFYGSITGIASSNNADPDDIGPLTGIGADVVLQSNQTYSSFGVSIAGLGDVNGDGYSDIIIGAERYDAGESNEGAAFIFYGSATPIASSDSADPDGTGPLTGIGEDVMLQSNDDNDSLGGSVSSAGDVNSDGFNDVIVGAMYSEDVQFQEGGAYVLYGSAIGITSSDSTDADPYTGIGANAMLQGNQASKPFAGSAASAGDVNGDGYGDIIIGAYTYGEVELYEGAAFIFYGSDTGFTSSATLDPDGTGTLTGVGADVKLQPNQANANFGFSVASAGDVNGDGYGDVIVGSKRYEDGEALEGAAFIFYGSATGITSSLPEDPDGVGPLTGIGADVILQPNQEVTDSLKVSFAGSVASAGDVNGDGYGDVVVGAEYYNAGVTLEGAAFIFYGSASGIASSERVDPDGVGPLTGIGADVVLHSHFALSRFGKSVASAGDVNGDGYSDLMIGATYYEDDEADEGAVFMFYGSDNGIASSEAADPDGDGPLTGIGEDVMLQSNQLYSYFGSPIAGAGDINNDGYDDIVIGANNFDDGEDSEGTAFIFYGSSTGISSSHYIDPDPYTGIGAGTVLQSNQVNARFGISVAGAGDINGDSFADVIVSAYIYDDGEDAEGASFIFHGSATGIASSDSVDPDPSTGIGADIVLQGNQISGYFGKAVASAGDINGDGYGDIIVGADGYDDGELNEGAAFVFYSNDGIGNRYLMKLLQEEPSTEPALNRVTNDLRIQLQAFHPGGNGRAKLQVEACPSGSAFGSTACTTETPAAWSDIVVAGTSLVTKITGLPEDFYRWRARLVYDPLTLNQTDASHTHWFHPNGGTGNQIVRLVVDTNSDGVSDNVAPTIMGIPDSDAFPDVLYSFTPVGNDLNLFEPLTYSVQNLPSWASFNTITGELSGTPSDADFGVFSNIIITVADDEIPTAATSELGPFSITVTDPTGPTILSSTIDNYDGTTTISLTCMDIGSGCAGPIYYTTDGSIPTTASSVYSDSIIVSTGTTILTLAEDNEGNVSTVQAAEFISIVTPSSDFIGDVIAIEGTIDETYASVSSVTIQVYGDDGTVLVESGGNLYLLPPPSIALPLTTTLDNPLDSWSYSKTISWVNDVEYTIVATATDANGNTSSASSSFIYFNGTPSSTELLLTLTTNSILNGGSLDATLTFTKLNELDADLTGTPLILHVTDPDAIVTDITGLETNYAGQLTLDQLGAGGFGISFDKPGAWSLQAEFDNTDYPNMAGTFSSPEALLVGSSAGYAVLVQGKLPNDEGLESHNKTANRIYNTLKDRGLADQDIHYFNYDLNQSGVDLLPVKANIQSTIEGLATDIAIRPAPVYVIMVDHGGKATDTLSARFYIDEEVITPVELDGWLGTLEANMGGSGSQLAIDNPRIVIIGACYSGGFISDVTGTGRVIITSATEDEQSYKGPVEDDNIRVGEYFLEELFLGLGAGENLRDAFKTATTKTETYTKESSGDTSTNSDNEYLDTAVQHPLMDDDADGLGTNALFENTADGQLSKDLVLGINPDSLTNDVFNPADIVSVTDSQYLADGISTANLTLVANDAFQVNQAYVEIRSPATEPANAFENTTEQLTNDFDRQALIPPVNQGDPYTLTYSSFDQAGKYEIFYYVNDRFTGALSPAKRSIVYKDRPATTVDIDPNLVNDAPGAFDLLTPVSGDTGITITGFDWEDAVDPEGDAITYNFIIADTGTFSTFTQSNGDGTCTQLDKPYRQEELTSSSSFVDSKAKLCDLSTYVWKVEAVDAYGLRTTSTSVFTYNTNDTNADIGVIVAMVKSATTNAQLSAANIINNFGETASATASVLYNGNYVLFTSNTSSAQIITASLGDYASKNVNLANVTSGKTIEILFNMDPDPSLDSDGDGVVDASDNCPAVDNGIAEDNQLDTDGDLIGDACDDDDDDDGIPDSFEDDYAFLDPLVASDAVLDWDEDSISNLDEYRDGTDPSIFNTIPSDVDGDGIDDSVDNCVNDYNPDQLDTDGDYNPVDGSGGGNVCDTDDDGDGMPDDFESIYGLLLLVDDAGDDFDGDGVLNIDEYLGGTNPTIINSDTTDTDADGVLDVTDNCLNIANGINEDNQLDTDGDSVGNACDTDDDNDGTADTLDKFPLNIAESADADNDGIGDNADIDDDNDGMDDAFELLFSSFPDNTPALNPLANDAVGDLDGDGVLNIDEFLNGTNPLVANNDTTDTDGDGVTDVTDNCPNVANGISEDNQLDTDSDGAGDACDADDDNDGVQDTSDIYPVNITESADSDGDGTGNNADLDDDNDGMPDAYEELYNLKPLDANDATADADGDGVSNLDEFNNGTNPTVNNFDTVDTDNDGVIDVTDNCPAIANGIAEDNQLDTDADSVGDACDSDDDNDNVTDASDIFPLDPSESGDADGDGIGNTADTDDDNDGMSDEFEILYALNPLDPSDASDDLDGDGTTNLEEFQEGTSPKVSNKSSGGGGGGTLHPLLLLALFNIGLLGWRYKHFNIRIIKR